MITSKVLRAIAPRIKPAVADALAKALPDAMAHGEINTPLRQAHFLAQLAHESAGFARFEENLNYSADRLRAVFKKYFTPTQAKRYAYKPSAIANRVYGNRNGNGNEASGDGWRFRGRGLIHLTFRSNYRKYGNAVGLPLEQHPDLAKALDNAALVAAEFWRANDCNAHADRDDLRGATKRVNGGLNGLADRESFLRRAKLQLMPKRVMPFAVVDGEVRIERVTGGEGGGQPYPNSVSEFRDDGSMVDGEGEADPAEMETAGPDTAGVPAAPDNDPVITPRSDPDLIALLQKELNARNYDAGAEDGAWGSLTRAAVLALQGNNDLPLDREAIRLSQVKAAGKWVIESRENLTETDLRKGNDPVIKKADSAETWSIWTAITTAGAWIGKQLGFVSASDPDASAVDKAREVGDKLSGLQEVWHMFEGVIVWAMANAIIVVPVGCAVVIFFCFRTRATRLANVKDARTA